MLRPNAPDLKVYLHRAPIDMRRGRNGLAAMVREVMRQDPLELTRFGGHLRVPTGGSEYGQVQVKMG